MTQRPANLAKPNPVRDIMVVHALAFYLFACIAVLSAVMVISVRNPVHAVLFLILTFFNAAALFLLMGAEFLAMVLVIVYVGAVAVLFMFVVMMLDINFVELRQGFIRYLPIGAVIGGILLAELVLVATTWAVLPEAAVERALPTPSPAAVSNTHALGAVLYTNYLYLFQTAGLVLLVAMIGAIVLTFRRRAGVRRQSIAAQTRRRPADTLEIHKVPTGKGL